MSPENVRAHVTAEVARGDEALRAAHELLRLGLLNDAVSRAYYAALHVARALLLTEGVEPQTHAGVSTMLGMHFVVPGRLAPAHAKELTRLEQFRNEADYNRFFVFTGEGASEEVAAADRFCAAGRSVLASGGWMTP
ncbi:MAG: HEPN domain-containing protein [Myxococcota bacterium]|nr:HEPN domain-containing protein [Myxococcota bacterium]